ncbi:MAG TPA: hypothetical protein VIJ39_14445 [Solirubrobacteraceae bacterium]
MAFESQASRPAGLAPEDYRPDKAGEPSARASRVGRLTAGGTDGNERLTATTGLVLLILLAILGVTILRITPLLNEHMFLGVLLIGPITLKLASTGYRFIRYYTSEARYRRKGPPATPLRLLAPIVVISTIVVFASGVALMLIGPSSRDTLLPIHKISFFVWVAATALHVLAHLADLRRVLMPRPPGSTLLADVEGSRTGRSGRALALCGALLAGVVLGIVSISQFAPWTHTHFPHH